MAGAPLRILEIHPEGHGVTSAAVVTQVGVGSLHRRLTRPHMP
jgi:hypothetical protein